MNHMRQAFTEVGTGEAEKTFPKPNLDQIASETEKVTSEDMNLNFDSMSDVAFEKLSNRKEKAFPVQSKQVNTDMGNIGNMVSNDLFNLQSIPRTLKTAWNFLDPRTPLPKLDDLRSDASLEQKESNG